MSQLLALVVAAIIAAGSTQIVFAKSGGTTDYGKSASNAQYGCQNGAVGSQCSQTSHPAGSHNAGSHNSHRNTISQGSHSSHP